MRAIFQKKSKQIAKYLQIWAKIYKICKYFENGRWLGTIIARNKLLEYVLITPGENNAVIKLKNKVTTRVYGINIFSC